MSAQSPQWIATARLLRRTGFGTSGPRVDAVVGQDWSTYLDTLLDADPESDPGAIATPMPVFPPAPGWPDELVGDELSAALLARDNLISSQATELAHWWVRRIAAVHEPIHEKLTLIWHNHFATSTAKVRYATYMAAQNQKLRTLALGDFRTLAYAMLTDAAMLSWLDGKDNVASSPNENLSREFMELFTLGEGNGYTESDVKEGARALTGWTVARDGQTKVVADKHDSQTKTVLGQSGDLDAEGFCDAVLNHPASAPYVATRLWKQLASDAPPSPQTLARLVSAYGQGRDLKALTKAILLDPEFVTASSVNNPMEWLLGVVRTLELTLDSDAEAGTAFDILTVLGQKPLYPPDVAGWPQGRAWVSTASITSQTWAVGELADRGDLSVIEEVGKNERIDAAGYLIGVGAWTDQTVAGLKPFAKNPRALFMAAVSTPEYLTT
ncbi:hypothetical protein A5724_12900 [Mycobacterium sp. ACS1612]|uniref:DUF1800 domain-containing protein n=1 Tax=Mycobacterium sp. ACS1612 TaxID=1834117 RepID=UPI000801D7BF|nr:DUF1800 domain-containing protein [Mycobacterium sp. ACS1612]OBF36755.1 hypothetical protein A5724_12900 [Mycobacterium sp. ACS1612]